jgi:DNA adenine methylase
MNKPVLRYHGGKWRLAPWVIEHFPRHGFYIEPFAGAASVLLRKNPSKVEVLNDTNGRLINCFRVLRDRAQAVEVMELLRLTPCAEEEYKICREMSDDPIEDARRLLVVGRQAHGSTGASGGKKSGWRRASMRACGPLRENDWGDIWREVLVWADRLRSVYIENDDACTVIERWDCGDALFYVDPPYPHAARSARPEGYAHEMTDNGHRELAARLRNVAGAVVLSGYPCQLYNQELYPDWHRVERSAMADKGKKRVEVLWLNEKAATNRQSQGSLFVGSGCR